MDQFRRALPISREFRSLSSPESAQKAMIFKGGISDRKEGLDILPSPSVSLGPPSDEIELQMSNLVCSISYLVVFSYQTC